MSWLSLQQATDIGPESSRALFESDLYDQDMLTSDKYKPHIEFAGDFTKVPACERLIIGLPGAGSHFMRCVLEVSQTSHPVRVIGELVLPEIDSEDRLVDPEINAAPATQIVYLEQSHTVCVDVRDTVHPVRTAAWARCLLGHIEARHVHVLDSITTAHYFTHRRSHEIAIPTLRVLKTTAARMAGGRSLRYTQDMVGLEVPNVISGLGASIITQCEMHRVPAEIVVSIEETHALEIEPIRAYEPLWLEATGHSGKSDIDYRALVNKHRPRAQSSLYL